MPCEAGCGDPCDWDGADCNQGFARPYRPCGPFSMLLSLFHCESYPGGCGERYWGEYISNPPYRHDPCGRCGSGVGGACAGGCASAGPEGYGYLAGGNGPPPAMVAGGNVPANMPNGVGPQARGYAGRSGPPAAYTGYAPAGNRPMGAAPAAGNANNRYVGPNYPAQQYPTQQQYSAGAYGNRPARTMIPGTGYDGSPRPYAQGRYTQAGYPQTAIPQGAAMPQSPYYTPPALSDMDQPMGTGVSGDPVMQSAQPRRMPLQR
jgi:hypothetical protein